MSFKEFYIHFHVGSNTKLPKNATRGFTCKVSPSELERMCLVRFAWCHSADQFVKKEGRSRADQCVPFIINKREVAILLCAEEKRIKGKCSKNQYDYVFKYLV